MQAQYQNQAPATIEGLIREVFEGEDFYSFEVLYEDSPAVDVFGYGGSIKKLARGWLPMWHSKLGLTTPTAPKN